MIASVGGLQGVWVDLLNPLNEDFSISHKKLSTHVKTLGAKGVSGIVMFGHGGEGQAFSASERLEAVKQMMALGVAGKDILLHVGFSSLMDSVQLVRAVQPLGLRGCIVTPPLAEGSITDTGLAEYFIQIAKKHPRRRGPALPVFAREGWADRPEAQRHHGHPAPVTRCIPWVD